MNGSDRKPAILAKWKVKVKPEKKHRNWNISDQSMQVEICSQLIVGDKFYRLHVSNLHLCAKRTGNSWYKYWALRWEKVSLCCSLLCFTDWSPDSMKVQKTNKINQHLDVYQRSLSAIHLHAAVHNCGRGKSNWGLRSCLKYFVFCRSLWLFFFCLVDRCLVVVWSYCCVPFSEEEKKLFILCCHPEFCIFHLMLAAVGLSGLPEL